MSFRSDILGIEETVRLMENIIKVRESQERDKESDISREDLIHNSSELLMS